MLEFIHVRLKRWTVVPYAQHNAIKYELLRLPVSHLCNALQHAHAFRAELRAIPLERTKATPSTSARKASAPKPA